MSALSYLRSLLLGLLLLSFSSHTIAQQCMWFPANNSNYRQVEGPSAVLNDKIYIFSGFGCDQANVCGAELENMTEVFDPAIGANGQWTNLTPMPVGVTHMPAVTVENEIWVIGGFKGNHGGPPTDTIQVYTPASDTWRYGPTLPDSFAAGGAVYIGRKVYVFGGLLPDRRTNTGAHFVYDLDNTAIGWQTLAPMPTPRNHMGFATIAGKIYTVGGQIGHDCCTQDRDNVEVYDPATDLWTAQAPLPDSISHMECGTFAKDGLVYVVAGNTNTYSTNRWMHTFNPETNTWTQLCDLPIKLWNPAAEIINDKLYIAHGGEWAYQMPSDKAYSYNITRNRRYELGFSPRQLNYSINLGQTVEAEATLYTISEETNFSLNSADFPIWITNSSSSGNVISPTGEKLSLTLDPFALGPGTYTFDVIASENNTNPIGYSPDTLRISITVVAGSPLGIDDVSAFEARPISENQVMLTWETGNEEDLSFFEVERRKEQEDSFETIGIITAQTGARSQGAAYSFKDSHIMASDRILNYRLRYVAKNGTVYFSEIETVTLSATDQYLIVYPNPAQDHFVIRIDIPEIKMCTIRILDLGGKELIRPISGNMTRLSTHELAPGCYIIEAITDKGTLRKKVIVE